LREEADGRTMVDKGQVAIDQGRMGTDARLREKQARKGPKVWNG
jgi:hypothetical protein